MSAVALAPLASRVGGAGQLVVGHAATAAGSVYDTAREPKGKSTGWMVVGYSLVLILLYVLIADKRVVSATTKLVGGAQTAAEAWVKPADPVALLSERFGATPKATGSTGAGSEVTGSTGGGGAATGSKGPESGAELRARANASSGKVAVSPKAAGNLHAARRRYGVAAPGLYAKLRAEAIRKGVLRP